MVARLVPEASSCLSLHSECLIVWCHLQLPPWMPQNPPAPLCKVQLNRVALTGLYDISSGLVWVSLGSVACCAGFLTSNSLPPTPSFTVALFHWDVCSVNSLSGHSFLLNATPLATTLLGMWASSQPFLAVGLMAKLSAIPSSPLLLAVPLHCQAISDRN